MKFAVIGIGYFGAALARELSESGHEVLAIDLAEAQMREIRDVVTLAAVADGTDIVALEQLGVAEVDTAVVSIGEGFEASLVVTAHLQKLGVPKVHVRIINEVHERLLDLMGVSGTIRAEDLAATYFSRQIMNESVHRYFGIDRDHAIVELALPDSLDGKTLEQSELRSCHRINAITVRRPVGPKAGDGASYATGGTLGPDFVLHAGDRLIVFGRFRDIEAFCGTAG